MCQGCVDNGYVSQAIYDKIEAFLSTWPRAEFGPAHIVLSDCNTEAQSIQWCLEHWDEYKRDHAANELEATKAFLHELLDAARRN